MKISIALCSYNGQKYFEEQLQSIFEQTRLPDELVMGDDGSTDQTLKLANEYAQRASFPVKIISNKTQLGVTANFSKTITQCTGDLILTCDQDDIWLPQKVAVFEKIFMDDSQCLLAFSDLQMMQADGTLTPRTFWGDLRFSKSEQQIIQSPNALQAFVRRNVVVGTAMGFRSELAEKALPVPEVFMHDEWIALIASLLGRIRMIPKPLVSYRLHPNQAVGSSPGLFEQWRYAKKKMRSEYFENRIRRAQYLAEAVEQYKSQLINPRLSLWIPDMVKHARAMTQMHRGWLTRWPLILNELLTGRYHKYDYGFKGVVRDILL